MSLKSKPAVDCRNSLNPIEQLESDHLIYPDQLSLLEYAEVERRIDIYRIAARGGIAAVLMEPSIRSLLPSFGITDPVASEREKISGQRSAYIDDLIKSGICADHQIASEYANKYFQALPVHESLAIFQVQLQNSIDQKITPTLTLPDQSDLAAHFQYIHNDYEAVFSNNSFKLTRDECHQMLTREIIWKIKFHLAARLGAPNQQYPLLCILKALSKLSQNHQTNLTAHLQPELTRLTQIFSSDPTSRQTLGDFCFSEMSRSLDDFTDFSHYLQKLSIKTIEGEELSQLLTTDFLESKLDQAWAFDQKNFFKVLEFLIEMEILDKSYLHSDKIVHRTIESFLLSWENGEGKTFQLQIIPYILKLGILPAAPKDPQSDFALLHEYKKLCLRLKKNIDPSLDYHYSNPRSSPDQKPKP